MFYLHRLSLLLVLAFFSPSLLLSCVATSSDCIDEIQLSEQNPSGKTCTIRCDCNNLKYEGFCVEGRCLAAARTQAQRQGETRPCRLFQKIGPCEWGIQEAQPHPLRELLWGDCIPYLPVAENTKETCLDDKDNDCNGILDLDEPACAAFCRSGMRLNCYNAPPETLNQGSCKAGIKQCKEDNTWSACEGAIVPKAEQCNGQDDDCNGLVDDGLTGCNTAGCTEGEQRPCYPHLQGCLLEGTDTRGYLIFRCFGTCQTGIQRCSQGQWSACEGDIPPETENCDTALDRNCDGRVGEGCTCDEEKERNCSLGRTLDTKGICTNGLQRCINARWSDCIGATRPQPKRCDGKDNDCDGQIDDGCPCLSDADCPESRCVDGACRATGCPQGTTLCNEQCVNLQQDPLHCGACSKPCSENQNCIQGLCLDKNACLPQQTRCNDQCVDTQSDPTHCGACNNRCSPSETCILGSCEPEAPCPPHMRFCTDRCADLNSDTQHCGACNNRCPSGDNCSGGQCIINPCATGRTLCNGACVDLLQDPDHCGSCGISCDESCVNGRCTCSAPKQSCSGQCVDISNHPDHCGSCGISCSSRQCNQGRCVPACSANQHLCNGLCFSKSNPAHCGTCNNSCTPEQTCTMERCQCIDTQKTACPNAGCVDIQSDSNHCGACNNACPQGQICQGGQCGCSPFQSLCQGACTDLQSNTNHCGACNNACSQGKTCQNGSCQCPQALQDCAGACTDLQSNSNHCGACNNACPQGKTCQYGRCLSPFAVVAGGYHSCLLTGCGDVKCWGKNTRGQLGSGSSATRGIEESLFFAPDPQRTTQQIIAANEHTCALLDDHSVKCWGDNTRGQLGYNDTTQRNIPDSQSLFLGAGRTAKQIAAYHQHTCALLDDHSVKCWGDNTNGQLGYNDTAQRNAPPATPINLGTGRTAKQIATGKAHTCALLDNNTVKCWGDNRGGQLGYGDTTQRNAPPTASVNLGTGRSAKQIAAASEHTCAILDNNTVKCWGKGIIGNGGNQQTIQSSPPANPINLGAGRTATSLVAGGAWTAACAFLDNDTVKCWGHKLSGNDPFDLLVGLPQTILRVNLHEHHFCVTLAENKARCWGQNDDQQLGYNYPSGDSPNCTIIGEICPNLDQTPILFAKKDRCNGVCNPIQENTAHCGACQNTCTSDKICARSRCASPALQLAMTDQTCILQQNQTLQCWDRFDDAPSTLPIDVGAGRTVKHFALGGFASSHICALLDNDTVKCWGYNGRGQLGYNDTVYRPLPTQETLQFPAGRKVIQLAAASELSCALLDDESVRCWGRSTAYSSSATTPINTLAPPTSAVNLGTGRTAKMLIGGFGRVCAILDDGTARCWSGRTENFNVGTGRHIKTLSNGTNLCAILDDDTAKCWGTNDNPALLPALDFGIGRTAKQLVAGSLHTCAILDNDHLVCWGNNNGGQLGYGDTTPRNSPPAIAVELGTGRKAIQIALGLSKTCALLDNHQLKCWGSGGLGYNDILQRNAPPSTVIRY